MRDEWYKPSTLAPESLQPTVKCRTAAKLPIPTNRDLNVTWNRSLRSRSIVELLRKVDIPLFSMRLVESQHPGQLSSLNLTRGMFPFFGQRVEIVSFFL